MSTFRPVTLITGASSGIGAELARLFAAEGHEIVMVARSEAQLNTVADQIGAAGHTRPHVVAVDLSRMDGGARLGHELAARGLAPAYVVNNAGFGLVGPAAELDRAEQLGMIDLNVRTLTDLSLRFVDSVSAHRGGILNVASVAGFLPSAGSAVYYATKAYVISFSEALSRELAPRNIRVTALCPGPVPTGFQQRAGSKPRRFTGVFVCSADEVARAGLDGLKAGKRLVVPGLTNKLVTLMVRVLPRATVLRLTDSRTRRREPGGPPWSRDR
jgi:short-subunit dehydrogenase